MPCAIPEYKKEVIKVKIDTTRRSPIPNKRSTINRIPDEPEHVSVGEVLIKPVKGIPLETYTLQKLVMLSDNMVPSDSDIIGSSCAWSASSTP